MLKARGFKYMGLTDHGVMQGLSEFHDTLKAAGIKPILGVEAYLTEDRHIQKNNKTVTWHLTLIAETTSGYQNLCKLSSWSFIDGVVSSFGRPKARADWELLEKYSEGVICLTGCMAGPVMSELMKTGDLGQARARTEQLIKIYGKENVYGEIQNVGITTAIPGDSSVARELGRAPLTAEAAADYNRASAGFADTIESGQVPISQNDANRLLVEKICKPLGLAYVGTGDVHYLNEDDANFHDAMICIGTNQRQKEEPRRFSLLPKKYHLRSREEMEEALGDWPEALDESVRIAERCNAEITYGHELLPSFPLPDQFKTSLEYLSKLCEQGRARLYPESSDFCAESQTRLEMELAVINNMGFNDYFLIVWDLFREARERNIPYGPGRGSAAGSIVAYSLGITQVCPLEEGLLFERFLNPDRKSMPDIDMDFGVAVGASGLKKRDELIEYAKDKYTKLYGSETAVAQIVTFGKFKAKGALRDSARVLAEPSEDGRKVAMRAGDHLAGLIPADPRATMESVWDDEIEGQRLRSAHGKDPIAREIIDQAIWMEGLVRNYGTHAAAVIIADHDLTNDLPLQKVAKDKPIETQYDMGISERLGLLKMDFLGLRNLDIIWDCIARIEQVHGEKLGDPYHDIARTDQKTYELLTAGETAGIFQFESEGMTGALKQIKPTHFGDLAAIVALYRPGPMRHIPTYARRKAGSEPVDFLDERLEDILGDTFGICIYQEQSMIIARELGGFTPGQADDLRKAIGKKLKDKMDSLKPSYLAGCEESGLSKKSAEELWADNEAAADYSFNKSHAVCYALIAYITAYLKANYRECYMADLMSSVIKDKDKLRYYLTDTKAAGITVRAPDVNRSLESFTVAEKEDAHDEFDILFGLGAINGVGEKVVHQIIEERDERGPFTSMFDLIRRLPSLGIRVIEAIAEAGALDQLPGSRKSQFEAVADAVEANKKRIRLEEKGEVDQLKNWLKLNPGPGQSVTARGERKFSPIESACFKAIATSRYRKDPRLDAEVAEEAILKKTLADHRRAARKELEDSPSTAAGIAGEEGSEDPVDRIANQRLDSERAELLSLAKTFVGEAKSAYAGISAEASSADQVTLLDVVDEVAPKILSETDRWDWQEMLMFERSRLGIFVTGHPLDQDREKWAYYVDKGLGQINSGQLGNQLRVCGALLNKQPITTKRGDLMYKLTVDDLTGTRQITLFADTVSSGIEPLLEEGELLVFNVNVQLDRFAMARADNEEEEEVGEDLIVQLIGGRVWRWDPESITIPKNIRAAQERITLHVDKIEDKMIEALKILSEQEKGEMNLYVAVGRGQPQRTSLSFEKTRAVFDCLRQFGQVRSMTKEEIENEAANKIN